MVGLEEEVCPHTAREAKDRVLHIMVVDDEEDLRAMMCARLEAAACAVTTAEGGSTGQIVCPSPGGERKRADTK